MEINHRSIHPAYDARIMATIIKRPYGFQLRVSHKLLPKDLWATFDTRDAAEQYGRQLEGLLAQGIVPAALLERDRVVPLEARKVALPRFVHVPGHRGVGQLQDDVLEVTREVLPQQALDVLKHEGLWADLADGSHGLGEHVAGVAAAAVLAAEREWLARGGAGDHRHVRSQRKP
jgi:hypothetical protein